MRSRGLRVVGVLGILLSVVVLAGGCVAGAPGVGDGGRPGSLVGRTFLSERVTVDGQPHALVPGTRIQVGFTREGQVTASAGCNHFSGPVQITRDRLLVGDLSSTDMACTEELGAQDELLARLLSADPAYALRGDRLRLEGGGTVVRLIDRAVEEPDRPLEGTSWHVESLIIGGDAISSPPAGTAATLAFAEGSVRVQVQDCNQGSASVEIGDGEIVVGPLAMTRRACQEGPTTLEAAVVNVLEGRIGYAIDGDRLTLSHPSSNGLMLRAAPDMRPAAAPG